MADVWDMFRPAAISDMPPSKTIWPNKFLKNAVPDGNLLGIRWWSKDWIGFNFLFNFVFNFASRNADRIWIAGAVCEVWAG